jgi:RNA polymerase sigma factor (sigma-70 family)
MPDNDVTRWLHLLEAKDQQAIQKLWELYFRRLLAVARKKLGALPRTARDEEDVALSAFASFCRGVAQRQFQQLENRHDLSQVLVLVTTRKALDQIAHERRSCRDHRRTAAQPSGGPDENFLLHDLVSREPAPGFAAEVADQCRQLLADLPDEQFRQIVLAKMEGHRNAEIAAQLGLSDATIERRLALVRDTWEAAGRQKKSAAKGKS